MRSIDDWFKEQNFKDSSTATYKSMWRRYVNWLNLHGIRISQVEKRHIATFLLDLNKPTAPDSFSSPINRHQRERYHRLIERVTSDILQTLPGAGNPVSQASVLRHESWRKGLGNEPMAFLRDLDRKRLIQYGDDLIGEPPFDDEEWLAEREGHMSEQWLNFRNRAIVGILLGGGLKVAEARGLTVYHTTSDSVKIEHSGKSARTVKFDSDDLKMSFVIPWLRSWLLVRERSYIFHMKHVHGVEVRGLDPKARLFCSNAEGALMHPSTMWRAVNEFATKALANGILDQDGKPARVTPTILRNDYAARLLEQGLPHNLVAMAMGYSDKLSVVRITSAWRHWRSVQEVNHAEKFDKKTLSLDPETFEPFVHESPIDQVPQRKHQH